MISTVKILNKATPLNSRQKLSEHSIILDRKLCAAYQSHRLHGSVLQLPLRSFWPHRLLSLAENRTRNVNNLLIINDSLSEVK